VNGGGRILLTTVDRAEGTPSIKPRRIRLEASSVCQLRCPSCPTAAGETARHIGAGLLKLADFKRIVDENPWVCDIELSNWGEMFLNPELLGIIVHAFKKNVVVRNDNGANLNHVSEEVLEALVRCRFATLNCSIDGASPETYAVYRRNGKLDRVIQNIRTINRYKERYASPLPHLNWQFIAFGHNEHEIAAARTLARELNMSFRLKLSWGDLHGDGFSPVRHQDLIRQESGVGAATREEYERLTGHNYVNDICEQLWKQPQINFDGKLLGCCINYWGDFGNAFREGLLESLNNERMNYARAMLMGKGEARPDIPCTTCKIYHSRLTNSSWIAESSIRPEVVRP
jgi:MoaA/NifB/PqqE/SkfB family radical SAM enzyme